MQSSNEYIKGYLMTTILVSRIAMMKTMKMTIENWILDGNKCSICFAFSNLHFNINGLYGHLTLLFAVSYPRGVGIGTRIHNWWSLGI